MTKETSGLLNARRAWISAGAPILALVLVVILLACSLVAGFAQRLDNDFAQQSRRLVASALDGRSRALANLTLDYAMWNEAYASVSQERDQAWIEENYYTAVADTIIVFRMDGTLRYAWQAEGLGAPGAGLAPATLRSALRDLDLPRPDGAQPADLVVHSRFEHAGRLMLVAVAAVTPEDAADRAGLERADADYVAIVDVMDAAELGQMGAALDLESLSFAASAAPDEVALGLQAADGRPLGAMTWRHERPGSEAFLGQLWPIVLSVLIVGALTILIARRLVSTHVQSIARTEAALESSRLKSEFIATMSHELRTPLNAIIGYAELIQEEAEPLGESVIAEDAGRVVNAGKHLRQLVNDILDQSRIDAGRLQLTIERVAVAGVLADVVELDMPLAKANGNTLIAAESTPGLEVLADDVRVRQCLLNLVANAAKFTLQGSIFVSAKQDGDAIVIDVADTGAGMTPEDMAQLFKPFAATSGSRYGGAGLGLSIAHKLARAMGGEISVRSEIRKGSVFSLHLPSAQAAVLEAA
jgi:signal transduction histidine kinase